MRNEINKESLSAETAGGAMKNSKSITVKTVSGFFWMVGGTGAQSVLRLVFTIVLSRLLFPADFGLVALATMITGFADIFIEMGVGSALIQKKDITDVHINTAFTYSLISALIVTVIFLTINPFLAEFFSTPKLEQALNILVWIFPIRIATKISYSLLQKELMFKKLAGNELVSNVIGFAMVGIPLAYAGYGFYSLVWANLLQATVYGAILFYHQPHSLKLAIDRKVLKELTSYGSTFTAGKVFNYWAMNGDNFIVGKLLGPSNLGYYNRAYNVMNLTNSIFGKVLDSVLFPSFAKIQQNSEKIRLTLDRGFSILLMVFIPSSIYIYILSPELISVLLGDKWVLSVLPLQVLSLGIFFRIGYKLAGSYLRGVGLIKSNLIVQVIYFISVVVASLIGSYFFGTVGVAWGVLISLAITFLMMCHYMIISSSYTWKNLGLNMLKIVPYTFIILVILLLIIQLLRAFELKAIVILIITAIAYVVVTVILYMVNARFIYGSHIIWFVNKVLNKKSLNVEEKL